MINAINREGGSMIGVQRLLTIVAKSNEEMIVRRKLESFCCFFFRGRYKRILGDLLMTHHCIDTKDTPECPIF